MYDLIIIGAGSAGISAYKEAIKHTQNLLIIKVENGIQLIATLKDQSHL